MKRKELLSVDAHWQASRFDGKDSFNLVLYLKNTIEGYDENGHMHKTTITRDIAAKVGKRLNQSLNHFCFGNQVRRKGKRLVFVAYFDPTPHPHLHILCELPNTCRKWSESETIDSKLMTIELFLEQRLEKEIWSKSRKTSERFYLDATVSPAASTRYNSRTRHRDILKESDFHQAVVF